MLVPYVRAKDTVRLLYELLELLDVILAVVKNKVDIQILVAAVRLKLQIRKLDCVGIGVVSLQVG